MRLDEDVDASPTQSRMEREGFKADATEGAGLEERERRRWRGGEKAITSLSSPSGVGAGEDLRLRVRTRGWEEERWGAGGCSEGRR